MSMMYCTFCDKSVDTDFMDHCEWGPFKCEVCVDNEPEEEELNYREQQYQMAIQARDDQELEDECQRNP